MYICNPYIQVYIGIYNIFIFGLRNNKLIVVRLIIVYNVKCFIVI